MSTDSLIRTLPFAAILVGLARYSAAAAENSVFLLVEVPNNGAISADMPGPEKPAFRKMGGTRSMNGFSGSLRGPVCEFGNAYRTEMLLEHNRVRALHGAPPLKIDAKATKFAQGYAEKLTDIGSLVHSGGPFGENLYGGPGVGCNGTEPVSRWYDEVRKYDYGNPVFSLKTGHFTQVVWKETRKVGFGVASKNGQTFVVAAYTPRGNVVTKFTENVLPTKLMGLRKNTFRQMRNGEYGGCDLDEYRKDMLKRHNELRRKHGSPPLEMDDKLEEFAVNYAQVLASRGMQNVRHSKAGYGENIFWSGGVINCDGAFPVQSWYDEIKLYDFKSGGYTQGTGHFTQVVWKDSRKIGIGLAVKGSEMFVVANYDPSGNLMNTLQDNVLPPREDVARSEDFPDEEQTSASSESTELSNSDSEFYSDESSESLPDPFDMGHEQPSHRRHVHPEAGIIRNKHGWHHGERRRRTGLFRSMASEGGRSLNSRLTKGHRFGWRQIEAETWPRSSMRKKQRASRSRQIPYAFTGATDKIICSN